MEKSQNKFVYAPMLATTLVGLFLPFFLSSIQSLLLGVWCIGDFSCSL